MQVGFQVAGEAREEHRLRKVAQTEEKAALEAESQQQLEQAAVRRLEQQLQLQQQVAYVVVYMQDFPGVNLWEGCLQEHRSRALGGGGGRRACND